MHGLSQTRPDQQCPQGLCPRARKLQEVTHPPPPPPPEVPVLSNNSEEPACASVHEMPPQRR